jgi:hypothetical protein
MAPSVSCQPSEIPMARTQDPRPLLGQRFSGTRGDVDRNLSSLMSEPREGPTRAATNDYLDPGQTRSFCDSQRGIAQPVGLGPKISELRLSSVRGRRSCSWDGKYPGAVSVEPKTGFHCGFPVPGRDQRRETSAVWDGCRAIPDQNGVPCGPVQACTALTWLQETRSCWSCCALSGRCEC